MKPPKLTKAQLTDEIERLREQRAKLCATNAVLRGALIKIRRMTFQRNVDAHAVCRRCGEPMFTEDGLEPTELCNSCAQDLVIAVHAVAAKVMRPPPVKCSRTTPAAAGSSTSEP